MKKLGNQKGITLVALVVTIIVLLILAGVSLSLVAGNNGILSRATKAVDTNEVASAGERAELLIAEAQTAYYEAKYVSSSTTTDTMEDYVKSYLASNKTSADENVALGSNLITVSKGGTTIAQVSANIGAEKIQITGKWTKASV